MQTPAKASASNTRYAFSFFEMARMAKRRYMEA